MTSVGVYGKVERLGAEVGGEGAAAVEDKGLAGEEFGGDEEEDGVGDFVGAAGALEGSAADEIGLPFGGIAGHGDSAGGDGVHADGGGEFLGEDAGHENDAGFGDGVGEKFTPAEQATNIGEIDDDALPGLGEMGSSGLGAEEGGFEIGV